MRYPHLVCLLTFTRRQTEYYYLRRSSYSNSTGDKFQILAWNKLCLGSAARNVAHSTDTLDVRNLIMDWFVWRKCPLVEPRVQHVPFVAGWCRGCQSLVSSRLERSALLTSTVWLSPLAESEFCWINGLNNNLIKVLIARPILQPCRNSLMFRCSNITASGFSSWSLSATLRSQSLGTTNCDNLSTYLWTSAVTSVISLTLRAAHRATTEIDTMPAYCSHLHLSCSTWWICLQHRALLCGSMIITDNPRSVYVRQ